MTNQIVTKLSHDVLELSTLADTGGGGGEEEGVVTAALGNAWYHSVTTRLLLEPVQGAHRLVSIQSFTGEFQDVDRITKIYWDLQEFTDKITEIYLYYDQFELHQ